MEPKTFQYEAYYEQKLNFEIDDEHFKYRPDQGEEIIAPWQSIESLKINRFGNTLEIWVKDRLKPIIVPFGTENFLIFLEEIMLRLGHAAKDRIKTASSFTVSNIFYLMMILILSAPVFLLFGLILNLSVLEQLDTVPAVSAFLIPMALIVYGGCVPIRAVPEKNRLVLKGLLRRYTYDYSQIEKTGFELLDMKKRGQLLVISLEMKNGKKIRIKWLKDLLLFSMSLRYHLNAYKIKSR